MSSFQGYPASVNARSFEDTHDHFKHPRSPHVKAGALSYLESPWHPMQLHTADTSGLPPSTFTARPSGSRPALERLEGSLSTLCHSRKPALRPHSRAQFRQIIRAVRVSQHIIENRNVNLNMLTILQRDGQRFLLYILNTTSPGPEFRYFIHLDRVFNEVSISSCCKIMSDFVLLTLASTGMRSRIDSVRPIGVRRKSARGNCHHQHRNHSGDQHSHLPHGLASLQEAFFCTLVSV